ncbi:MAG: hypothetical protein J1F27_06430 [Prevotellaceae bacterium]|nr:hypothetical protein [Prevotellaceae bacterium]
MKWFLLLAFLLPVCQPLYSADKKQPKPEKLSSLRKTAKTALKNRSNQDAARNGLLGALSRDGLKNKQRADIYYIAALLEESLNGVENQKAYLKQSFDTARFFNKLSDMYAQLRLCDSVDLVPDVNGRVRPRMQKKTRSLRLKHRRNILGGGKFFLAKQNFAAAYLFFDLYSTYRYDEPVDSLLRQAVCLATLTAFQVENYLGTIKHADEAIAYSDSSTSAILLEYKARAYAQMKDNDGLLATLKRGVHEYPEHDYFFVHLADWYHEQRQFAEERKLADELVAAAGGRAIYYYAKSKSYLAENDYESCIAYADSAIALQPDYADAYYNKGIAYLNMAIISQENSCKDVNDSRYATDKERTLDLYRKARPCMEMVRRLQPEKQDRWASPLYRIYLNLNSGEEFVEIDRILNGQK